MTCWWGVLRWPFSPGSRPVGKVVSTGCLRYRISSGVAHTFCGITERALGGFPRLKRLVDGLGGWAVRVAAGHERGHFAVASGFESKRDRSHLVGLKFEGVASRGLNLQGRCFCNRWELELLSRGDDGGAYFFRELCAHCSLSFAALSYRYHS